MNRNSTLIILSLLAMYLIWGSTYLGIRIALESFPPLLMTGARFLVAGGVLTTLSKLRGDPWPKKQELVTATIVGTLLMGFGVGGASFAEQWVSSGLTAVAIATMPLWSLLFSLLWKERPATGDWIAIFVGLSGVVLLNLEESFRANPAGALVLFFVPISWAFGSNLSKHRPLPAGSMSQSIQFLASSVFLLVLGLVRGERIPTSASFASVAAWSYLVVFGSIVAFSAYMYVVRHTRLAVATSYAYVNPVIALSLGALVAGESITPLGAIATAVIVSSVLVLTLGRARRSTRTQPVPIEG